MDNDFIQLVEKINSIMLKNKEIESRVSSATTFFEQGFNCSQAVFMAYSDMYGIEPEIIELEEEFQEKLGTRVHIDKKELGGQIKIDFFSTEDLRTILDLIQKGEIEKKPDEMLEKHIENVAQIAEIPIEIIKDEVKQDDADLYNISNFSI